ncbi:hypothetical protein P7K49_003765 [Saguinus oedipus]|uniref:Uncharacterized protein n=1 Tax=Saguinus oedipus TaxID=9490 RepID=A0ABQ9W5G2_SAGOE|nr:hypothetical protein P7K49_003765 [Saguinus oedipus]
MARGGRGRAGGGSPPGKEPLPLGPLQARASQPQAGRRGAGAQGLYAASTPADPAGICKAARALWPWVQRPSRAWGETRGCGGGPRGGPGPSQLRAASP